MRVILYLLLLAVISGTRACLFRPRPKPTCNCGSLEVEDGSRKDTRIIGGSPPVHHQYPFMARIERRISATQTEICGGSLISKDTILTAAHCVENDDTAAHYRVTLGDHDKTDPDTLGKQIPEVKFVAYMEEYDGNDYDYGIIKLKKDVLLTFTVQTVCLPNDASYDDDRAVTAMGWGIYNSNGQFPSILQKVNLFSSTDLQRCAAVGDVAQNDLTARMMCMFAQDPNASVCSGDSGGPVVTIVVDADGRQRYVQTGVIGQSVDDCDFSVAFRVSDPMAMRWIKEMRDGQCISPIPTLPNP